MFNIDGVEMGKIVAMIPARMSSKRVKKKNIRLINDKPMNKLRNRGCKKNHNVLMKFG